MERNKLIEKSNIYTFCLVMMPILNIYSSGIKGLGLGDTIMILFSVYYFINEKRVVIDRIGYWVFLCYIFFVSIILLFYIQEYTFTGIVIKMAKMILYAYIIFNLSRNHLIIKKAIVLYIHISFVASLYLLIQALFQVVLKIYLPVCIPFLQLSTMNSGGEYHEILLSWYNLLGFRYSGFFLEPATFCQYTVFSIIFILFANDFVQIKYRKTILAVICLSIVVSMSAMGYIFLCIVLALWLIKKSNNYYDLIKKMIFFTIVIVGLIFAVFRTGTIDYLLSRIGEVNNSNVSSGNIRIMRGFEFFDNFPLFFKLFGIGGGNFSGFVQHYRIVTRFDSFITSENEYMSGISTVLVYGGVTGISLFSISMISLFKNKDYLTRTMLIMIMVILFVASSLLSAGFVTSMSFVYALVYGENRKNIEKA